MEQIKVNGKVYELNGKEDLERMMLEEPEDWYSVRTRNATVIEWQYELYEDELDRQDEKNSTGSYGKRKEVGERVQYAIDHGTKMYLHDVKCRRQNMDDQKIGRMRIEHKTGFAQWSYGATEKEAWNSLEAMATKGIVMSWDPFKDEELIVMPLRDLLNVLAEYNPEKGLGVWFSFKKPTPRRGGQLQIQPVTLSETRKWWIEALIRQEDPKEYVAQKKAERKANRDAK